MPDFERQFVIDRNVFASGFSTVLRQRAGTLAFFSRPFAARHNKLAVYDRELIGLVQVVEVKPKWWNSILVLVRRFKYFE